MVLNTQSYMWDGLDWVGYLLGPTFRAPYGANNDGLERVWKVVWYGMASLLKDMMMIMMIMSVYFLLSVFWNCLKGLVRHNSLENRPVAVTGPLARKPRRFKVLRINSEQIKYFWLHKWKGFFISRVNLMIPISQFWLLLIWVGQQWVFWAAQPRPSPGIFATSGGCS